MIATKVIHYNTLTVNINILKSHLITVDLIKTSNQTVFIKGSLNVNEVHV